MESRKGIKIWAQFKAFLLRQWAMVQAYLRGLVISLSRMSVVLTDRKKTVHF